MGILVCLFEISSQNFNVLHGCYGSYELMAVDGPCLESCDTQQKFCCHFNNSIVWTTN